MRKKPGRSLVAITHETNLSIVSDAIAFPKNIAGIRGKWKNAQSVPHGIPARRECGCEDSVRGLPAAIRAPSPTAGWDRRLKAANDSRTPSPYGILRRVQSG